MKPIGKLNHLTKSGNLVLRGKDIPTLYSFVGFKDRKIGKIQDVVGPASRPYIIVRPVKKFGEEELASFKDALFYELPRDKKQRRDFGKKG